MILQTKKSYQIYFWFRLVASLSSEYCLTCRITSKSLSRTFLTKQIQNYISYQSGKNWKAIFKAWGLQQTRVGYIITNEEKKNGTALNFPKSGWPTKITPRENLMLFRPDLILPLGWGQCTWFHKKKMNQLDKLEPSILIYVLFSSNFTILSVF